MFKLIKSIEIHKRLRAINEALDPKLEKRLRKDLKKYCEETGHDYVAICKVAGLDTGGFEKLTSDIVEFLNDRVNGAWEYNSKTKRIDIKGNFNLGSSSWGEWSSSNVILPVIKKIRFGKIDGDFTLIGKNLTDEIWEIACPLEITGTINLGSNELTKVILPEIIGGGIRLNNNSLVSLEGCPEIVNGRFDVNSNHLENLIGGPIEVKDDYSCQDQRGSSPFSLEGCAEIIRGLFDCSNNRLVSLKGGPIEVKGGMRAARNSLIDLKGNFKILEGRIDVKYNNLATLEGIPLGLPSYSLEVSKNLIQPAVIKETYKSAGEMKSWIAAYLKLAATQRFKRMGKAQRDPIVARITPEILAKNPVALAPIWNDKELLDDPVIKRRMKKSGISKNDSFKEDAQLASDLLNLGF